MNVRKGLWPMDDPIILLVAVGVLILIFGQAYVWWRRTEKRRAEGTLGEPLRPTRGVWLTIAGVIALVVIFVVVVPLLEG
jgi:uncharacterized membrane protein YidH (DUF202 family)